ncbi:MAG TPA: hypothetical protein GYA07_05020 [Verrucomicrobia bacterium]|nr:hypothetical protein [Verrucomicrobiota bacterium]
MSEVHVSNLIDAGELAAINVGGGSKRFWRILPGSISAFKGRRNSLKTGA